MLCLSLLSVTPFSSGVDRKLIKGRVFFFIWVGTLMTNFFFPFSWTLKLGKWHFPFGFFRYLSLTRTLFLQAEVQFSREGL